jgi:hypothetical protein
MEPRALTSGHATPFKDQKVKDKNAAEFDIAQRALSELSLNEGTDSENSSNQRNQYNNAYAKR